MRAFSNAFTAFAIVCLFISTYVTLYEVISLPLGFSLVFMSCLILIASMVSALPDETELTIHRQIKDAGLEEDKE